MAIRWVFFDIGETLVDETRAWGEWADWLGVPRLTLFAALGIVIARNEHHLRAFEMVRPGIDVARENAARVAAGKSYSFGMDDLYPDALPCLEELHAGGFKIGLAGNQDSHEILARLQLPVDVIASSALWGAKKPSPVFFARLIETAGVAPHEIAYVGDRIDNDIAPARSAGLFTVFLRRGPWGLVQAESVEVRAAHMVVESLQNLTNILHG